MHIVTSIRRLQVGSLIAFALLLGACGGPSQPEPDADAVEVVAVEATSSTSVRVTFDVDVGSDADEPGHYRITADAGADLEVVSAHRAGPRIVDLATAPQDADRTYRLHVEGLRADADDTTIEASSSSFGGSSERAPIVASAIALKPADDEGPAEILVTFAFPPSGATADMSDRALDTSNYDIAHPDPAHDKTPDLDIVGARWADATGSGPGGDDRSRVILSTEAQQDVRYELKVTNVTSSAGDKLIDPENATVAFAGIPSEGVDPRVTGAVATSNTSVLVSFDQPMTRAANDASHYTIRYDDPLVGGEGTLAVEEATLRSYDTQVELTTEPMFDERIRYTLSVDGSLESRLERAMDPDGREATFDGIGRDGPIDGDDVPPRVTNVGALDNTTVRVTFSKPVRQDDAERPANYRIVGASALEEGSLEVQRATLGVHDATFDSESRTAVTLTTDAQSDLEYLIAVTDVRDLAGNQIAPPELGVETPSRLRFFGIPPSGELPDSDCDGVPDHIEARGWVVRVTQSDGTVSRHEVTSDPGLPGESCDHPENVAARDTNRDGVNDHVVWQNRLDPRSADTDSDGLSDFEEIYLYTTDASAQDSDGDGYSDRREVEEFRTSPLDPDTTGDGFDDARAIALQNRDPLIANLPNFDVDVVGDVDLTLDLAYSAESASGTRFLQQRSSSTSLATQRSRTQRQSSATTTEWFINAGGRFQVGYDDGFTFEAEATVEGGYKESTTATFETESVVATMNEQARSMSTDEELSEDETLVRDVVGASMASAIEITNLSDIAFTLSNVEVTAKIRDPRDLSRFVPVATLVGTTDSFNVGPAPATHGPLRFEAIDVSVELVEELRRNPQGLVFEVVNYDVTDEFGRNFAYTFQDVGDRTATLMIDYAGFRQLEAPRVATAIPPHPAMFRDEVDAALASYNDDQDALYGDLEVLLETLEEVPEGLTMRQALEDILGLTHYDYDEEPTNLSRDEIHDSYVTREDATSGKVELWRLRDVASDDDEGLRWFVEVPRGTSADDFNAVPLRSGQLFKLMFGQDQDGDGLTLQEEALFGSIDSDDDALSNDCFGTVPYPEDDCVGGDQTPDSRDTARIGLDDDEQTYGRRTVGPEDLDRGLQDLYDPWRVFVNGRAYRTNANPGRIDTDGDGLTDCQELGRCPIDVYLFAPDAEPGDAPLDVRYDGEPDNGAAFPELVGADADAFSQDDSGRVYGEARAGLWRGFDGLGHPAEHPTVDPLWTIVLDADAATPTITDPRNQDTDGDGLSDFDELVGFAYEPLNATIDLPRLVLPPYAPRDDAGVLSAAPRGFATNPLRVDTDGDSVEDGREARVGIDPTVSDAELIRDSSGDGLSDWLSRQGWRVAFMASDHLAPNDFADLPDRGEPGTRVAELVVCEPRPYDEAYADCRIVPMDQVDGIASVRAVPDDRGERGWRFEPSIDEVMAALSVPFGNLTEYTRDGSPLPNTTADPHAFDTSGNGLSDLEEYQLGTHPRLEDTDGDGVRDDEEVEGLDFPSDDRDPFRYTDPLHADTDRDGLTDGVEARDPWVVNAVGREPYQAASDPLRADADGDGLTDAWERHVGTDPAFWDSDEDGAGDFVEVAGEREGVETNPLRADEVVVVAYTNATVINSCFLRAEQEFGEVFYSSFFGDYYSLNTEYDAVLMFERPDGSVDTLADLSGLQGSTQPETQIFGSGARRAFALPRGTGFRMFGSTLVERVTVEEENGDVLGTQHIEYGSFSRGYSYPSDSGSFTESLTGTYETEEGNVVCEVSISWTVHVVD